LLGEGILTVGPVVLVGERSVVSQFIPSERGCFFPH